MNAAGPSHTIEHLPSSTRSKLRSTQILTSLTQIISELVQNSLDAGARQVDIGIDCEEWSCWVRDDGIGIDRDGLALLADGSDSGRYGTSKAYTSASLGEVSTFGFRGEALASAADLSCLEISTRTARSQESWSVILKGGRSIYNGPSIRWRREYPGTVVSIRDAFYNLPIRRVSHTSPARTIELIRKDIEAFALVFPHVSLTLENTHKTKEGSDRGRIMTVPKTISSLAAFRHLYGRALAEHVEELDESFGEMKLQGFISLEGAHSKTYQFLYINRHLLTTCDLHRVIDVKFSMSSFMKHAYDESGETSIPRSTTRRSPRRMEKKPVYVLNLIIPPQTVDNCLEPAKAAVQLQNSEAVSAFLSSVVEAFLVRHGFLVQRVPRRRPRTSALPEHGDIPSPRKKRKITTTQLDSEDLDNRRLLPPSFLKRNACPSLVAHLPHEDNGTEYDTDACKETLWTDPVTGETFVIDTRTGNSYLLHAPLATNDEGTSKRSRRSLAAGVIPMTADTVGRRGDEEKVVPNWIRDALGENSTYALSEPHIPSVSLSSALATDVALDSYAFCNKANQTRRNKSSGLFSCATPVYEGTAQPGRFSKEDLPVAKVLGQVDRKFIACILDTHINDSERDGVEIGKVPKLGAKTTRGKLLVLIDQHAADERVRVERFLKELCLGFLHHRSCNQLSVPVENAGVQTRELDPPWPILLTPHEASRLVDEDVWMAFERWGISFVDLDQHVTSDRDMIRIGQEIDEGLQDAQRYSQVLVGSVPELVGDKLLVGDELRDIVKGYLAKLDSEGPPSLPQFPLRAASGSPSDSQEDDMMWQKALRWCPRELLELVNSKACRGAIMFNDSLTLEQCNRLVQQLAETSNPFQCAHGRPSLVPLVDIGFEVASGLGHRQIRMSKLNNVNWSKWSRK
ncbi:hypothetical protein AcV5_001344 [Taiwanofungus camphoratus]|nr:hypothetical protein AcW2_006030 [Antrodia cinnamomea]KAI0940165.1 hypothetical protein AcV5_001344 [Antrodia cinnamomea]